MEIKKLTEMDLEKEIVNTKFFYDGTFTICLLTLRSGFKIIGESACMNPKDYNKKIGEEISLNNATDKIWQLLGFHLKQEKYEQEKETNNENI